MVGAVILAILATVALVGPFLVRDPAVQNIPDRLSPPNGAYWFDTEKNRAVAVHPAIIRESLTKVYKADALLRELGR